MPSKENSSKKKKRTLEDLEDLDNLKDLDKSELVKKCFGLINLMEHRERSSHCHNRSRRSRNTSGKENNNPHKKSRRSKQSARAETSIISEDRACRSCATRESEAEENRKKSGEDKMADIAAALREESPATSAPSTDPSRGVHSSFVHEWKRIVREGLGASEVEEIATKYKRSEDSVKDLRAPELNVEVRSLVDSTTLKIDESYAARQNRLAVQLSVIDRVLGVIAERGKQSTEVARLVESLHDFGRNDADIHHEISLVRRQTIVSSLDIKDAEAADIQCDVGEKLFSRAIEMLLYKRKVRTDVEQTVRPIVASLKDDFQEIVQAIAARWEKGFLERLKEVADDLKRDLAQAQNSVVAPFEEGDGAESRPPEVAAVAAKIEGARLAKVEGARLAKAEAASNAMSDVPSKRDAYPGGEELAKRATEQIGVPNNYSKLAQNTRKSYGRFIREWWYFCQRMEKNVFQPSASDVLQFYQEQARLRRTMDVCKRAMGHIMPERIVRDPGIILFIRNVKNEPL